MHVFKLIWNQGHTRIDNWWGGGGGGAVIRIFMLANLKNNRFQKKVIGQNTNILIIVLLQLSIFVRPSNTNFGMVH